MKTKLEIISSERWLFLTDKKKIITVIMKISRFVREIRKEFPQGYKLSWIAYNEENPTERIILDNHHGKSLHWHNDEREEEFGEWISLEKTKELFRKRVISKFGFPVNEL